MSVTSDPVLPADMPVLGKRAIEPYVFAELPELPVEYSSCKFSLSGTSVMQRFYDRCALLMRPSVTSGCHSENILSLLSAKENAKCGFYSCVCVFFFF